MKVSKGISSAVVGVAVALLSISAVHALDKYSTTMSAVLNRGVNDVKLKKKLLVKFSASTTDLVGGMTIQIVGSGIDCPPNNDGGTDYKCGVDGSPQPNHVLALNAEFGGTIQMQTVGLTFSVEKGKPILDLAEGKNKINAIDTAFGPFVTFIYNQPLGIGFLKIHEPGSDPTDCNNLLLGNPQGCLDGDAYAFEGLNGGYDCLTPCTLNFTCWIASNASICSDVPGDACEASAICHTQDCTLSTQCLRYALGVGCDSITDQCCDPANPAGTPCACASTADCGSGKTCTSGVCG